MIRIKRGSVAAKRRHRYLRLASGYSGSNSTLSTMIAEQVIQSFNFQYIGRKLKKRNLRRLWLTQINIALDSYDLSYSAFAARVKTTNMFINRKMLATLTQHDLLSFHSLILNVVTNNYSAS